MPSFYGPLTCIPFVNYNTELLCYNTELLCTSNTNYEIKHFSCTTDEFIYLMQIKAVTITATYVIRPTEFILLSSWQRGYHRGPGSDTEPGYWACEGGGHKTQYRPPRPALLRLQGWEGHRQGENHCLKYILNSL